MGVFHEKNATVWIADTMSRFEIRAEACDGYTKTFLNSRYFL